jgi:hypothetical protein
MTTLPTFRANIQSPFHDIYIYIYIYIYMYKLINQLEINCVAPADCWFAHRVTETYVKLHDTRLDQIMPSYVWTLP